MLDQNGFYKICKMSFNLSQLLNTLNGAEKRYCSLYLKTFSNKKGQNKILNDFHSLQHASKKAIVKKKYTPEGNSTRLFYKLVDALYVFHQESLCTNESVYSRRARLLFAKGLYKEGYRLTEKVVNSNPHEHHLLKMETIELRMLHALKTSDVDYLNTEFKNDKKRLVSLSKEYFNLIEFELLWASFRLESTDSYFFGKKNTLQSKLLKKEVYALSPFAKILFNKIKGFIAVKEQAYPEANYFANRAKQLYEEYPYLIAKDPGDYLRSLANICLSLIFNKSYSEAADILQQFDDSPDLFSKSKKAEVITEYFSFKVLMRLVLAISNGEFKVADYEISELEKLFDKYKDFLPVDQRLNTNLSFAVININNGNYRKAIKQINFVLKHSESFRRDIFHLALMAELSVHYLLGNVELLESKLNSFKRHLTKEELPFGFEKDLPYLLGKIIHSPGDKTNFTNLHDKITSSIQEEGKFIYTNYITLLTIKPVK